MPDNFRSGPPRPAPNLARRRMLVVAAGGVMVGLGTVVSRGGGRPASAASSGPPRPAAARPSVTPGLTRAAGSARPSAAPASAPAKASLTSESKTRQPVYYLDDGPKVIALTIDDGPSPVYTPQVLSVLAKYGVTATFSMIGQNVAYYPAIAREVAGAGHTVINHTWNHANLSRLSASAQRTEIARASDAIYAATGAHPGMFRAPYGAWSAETLRYCAQEGLVPLDWSVDPRDWARPGVKEIVSTIMRTTRSGSIILEHDGGGNRSQTVAALKIVIPRLLDDGYRFAVA